MIRQRTSINGVLIEEKIDGKIVNIIGAASRVAAAAFKGSPVLVGQDEQSRRMDICSDCEFFTGMTCQKCGCIAKFKAKLATERCPIAKW